MSEWKEVRLGDLCYKVCSGGTPKSTCSAYYDGGTIPWLNTKEINYNRIYQTESHITEEGLNNSSAKWIDANSVIVAMYGATAGRVAMAKVPMTTNQACCNLMIDKTKADYDFIYYYLSNSYKHLLSMANGAAQQNLNAQVIKDFIISLPDINEQHSIASFLSALDDKIAVNRRICENLEAQAQALFKHWFIDFAPFKNGKFVESKLGMIPEGWRVMSIDDIYSIKYGKNLPTSKIKEKGDYPVYGANGIMGYYNTYNYDNYVTLITSRGSGSGDVSRTFQKKAFITNNSFAVNPKDNYSYLGCGYTYYCIKNINFKPFCSGSAQPQLTNTSISAISILLPDKNVVIKYNSLASYIQKEINQAYIESNRLATLRDTLLPKLMSGQIKVNETEKSL